MPWSCLAVLGILAMAAGTGAAAEEAGEDGDEDEYTTVVVADTPFDPGTSEHLGPGEIEMRGAGDLPGALLVEPGVQIDESPKEGSTLELRGFDERSSLLTVAGIPVQESYDGHIDVSFLGAALIGSIDLELGVTSVLHGPGSMGGVITVNPPSGCEGGMGLDVSAHGGGYHDGRVLDWGMGISGCKQWSHLTLNLGAGYEHSDGYAVPDGYVETAQSSQYHEGGGLRDGSFSDREVISLLLAYAPSQHAGLDLVLDTLISPRGIPPFESAGYTRYWEFVDYTSFLGGITGWWSPALPKPEWGFSEVRVMLYSHVHRDEIHDYEDATYERLTVNPLAWFVASAYANETWGAILRTAWALNAGNRLEIALRWGLDVHRDREMPVPDTGEEASWGLWDRYLAQRFSVAVEDTQVLGSWRLVAGFGAGGMSLVSRELRGTSYDVDNRVLPAFEGRLVIEKTIGDRLRLLLAAGHKSRFPMLKELFSETVGGNPHLEVERAWMFETGFDLAGVPMAGFDVRVRLFANLIENMIEKYRSSYANVGRALGTGVEVEVRWAPLAFMEASVGYRYLFARDLVDDLPLDFRTPHRLVLGIRFLTRAGFTAGLEVLCASGQRSVYFDTLTAEWVNDELPPHVLVNGRLRYELQAGPAVGLYVFMDGRNLLDASYVSGSFEPRPGREVVIGLGVEL